MDRSFSYSSHLRQEDLPGAVKWRIKWYIFIPPVLRHFHATADNREHIRILFCSSSSAAAGVVYHLSSWLSLYRGKTDEDKVVYVYGEMS